MGRWWILGALGIAACSGAAREVDSGSVAMADAAFLSWDADAAAPDAGRGLPDAGDSSDAASPALHVLFIGNSYTYVNDLPAMVARIAATAGIPPAVTTDSVVQGSATLQDDWDNGIAKTRISQEPWTHVVLQGQSLEAVYPDDGYFAAAALEFGEFVTAAGARPTLFVTWARAAGDPMYDPCHGVYVGPDVMQDRITFSYADASRKMPGSILSCVGEAFRASLRDHPGIVLHQEDRSHPTLAGTYLAASTFYVALTGNPVPAVSEVPPGVNAQEAELLRAEALVGSKCADVQANLKGLVYASCGPLEFGASGIPLTQILYLTNTGYSTVGLSDGSTLRAPLEWTSGAYPGGYGSVTPDGLPFCSSSLAPKAGCGLSVSYSAAAEGDTPLTLDLTGAYSTTFVRQVHGSRTTRALLTVSENSGFFGCTDERCGPASVQAPGLNLVVSNRGGAPTIELGVGTPLEAPFYWGTDASGVFPGGSGKGLVEGVEFAYCTRTLGVGQQCILTVGFTAPTMFTEYESAVELAYSDAAGPVSPNANRSVRGAQFLP